MNLSRPPAKYDVQDQSNLRDALSRADDQNRKKSQDIEIGANCRAIFTDTVTGARIAMTVASGVVALTEIT